MGSINHACTNTNNPQNIQKGIQMTKQTTYTHRVSMMVATQVIMDVEAANNVDDIYKATLEAFKNGTGNPEVGLMEVPYAVRISPWLEEGQEQPEGWVNWPQPTDRILSSEELHGLLS